MNRRDFLAVTGMVLGSSFAGQGFAAAAGTRKNVLFVAVDDLRLELGCYGASYMKTPHIDKLAEEGLLFERAYCQQAICAPSRISLMTGLRPDSTKIYGLDQPLDKTLPDQRTIFQHFKIAGYKTINLGKIYHHDGDDKEFCDVMDRCGAPQYADKDAIARMARMKDEGRKKGLKGKELSRYGRGPAYEAGDVDDSFYTDGKIADRALEEIGKKDEKPLFLAVGFKKPHLPFVAPKKYWEMYDPKEIKVPSRENPEGAPGVAFSNWGEIRVYEGIPKGGDLSDELSTTLIHGYRACVSYIDAQLGRVISALKEKGLYEDTLVVLWGDHGWKLGEYGDWCKHTNFELDTHVPLIYRGQGIARGKRSKALVEYVDIFPTLSHYCGIPVPAGLEGLSSVPLFKDPEMDWKKAAFSQYPRGSKMGYSLRSGKWRYTEWRDRKTGETSERELYDHSESDVASVNLVENPAYKETVAELAKILERGWSGSLPE